MYYETMPLYPALRPDCEAQGCVRVPVFDGGRDPCPDMSRLRCQRCVTLENPCRPGERAEVLLGLDECGNLVVCVRREPERCCRPCPPRPCPPRESEHCCRPRPPRPLPPPEPRCGGRGRLYGTWR